MTAGERIARKRKELGLSQEALGEKLGVSRQAIYKWESDATLPEIEKLVALSRMFSVSVGWLLGVEEQTDDDASAGSGELTAEQMKLVEEIVSRYLAAAPKPQKINRKPFVIAGVVLAAVFISLFIRLDRLDDRYTSLQGTIHNVNNTVSRDIWSISSRVEEILKSQNHLSASYSTAVRTADLAANTITFTVRTVPRTYTEGMQVVFCANSNGTRVEVEGTEGEGREFSADVTCELTDDITLSAVFVTGDKRETQVLEEYTYLYRESFPGVSLIWPLWFAVEKDKDALEARDNELHDFGWEGKSFGEGQQARVEEVKVGLFKDRKLLMWLEEEWRTVSVNGVPTRRQHFVHPAVELERGHEYCLAVISTDQFGREWVWSDTPIHYEEGEGWTQVRSYDSSSDPADWEY